MNCFWWTVHEHNSWTAFQVYILWFVHWASDSPTDLGQNFFLTINTGPSLNQSVMKYKTSVCPQRQSADQVGETEALWLKQTKYNGSPVNKIVQTNFRSSPKSGVFNM